MKRNIDMKEISDGKLYTANDMVKADCYDCEGCSDCCGGMGNSIVLDPLDIWRLVCGTGMQLEELLAGFVEMNVVDGMILPNLNMNEQTERCAFLNEKGRCSIHSYRPGICRLFPLGRYYEEQGFKYFLQIHECSKKERGKVKVKKWMDTPDLKSYEAYIEKWHDFLGRCAGAQEELNEEQVYTLNLYVLKTFYQTPYPSSEKYETFYKEFDRRMKAAERFWM